MNTNKHFSLWKRWVAVFGMLMAFATMLQAAPMTNTPIDATETIDGAVITATTFSAANNSESTSYNYLAPSQVAWLKAGDQLTMAAGYAATTGTNYGTTGSPLYKITNGANSGYASKLEANKNYLIFHASAKEQEIATIKVTGYKPHTSVTLKFTIQELSGSGRSQLRYMVNGDGKQQPIESGSTNQFEFYYNNVSGSSFDKNELTILIRTDNWNEGDNCVYAISDFYVYGELDALNAEVDQKEVPYGESVTLKAVSNLGLDLTKVKWMKSNDGGNSFSEEVGTGDNLVTTPAQGKNYYCAVWEEGGAYYQSNTVTVTAIVGCSSESEVLFFEDFGVFDVENASSNNPYVKYSYVGYNKPVKEGGEYAVLANASYGGCGKGGKESNTPCDDCSNTGSLSDQLWFRDLYDHTSDPSGKFGGLLLVNADDELVYSREVEVTPNTDMNFAAYFADASGGDAVSVKFFVKDEDGNEIPSATLVVDGINYDDEWVRGETIFNTGNNSKVTVEIHSYNEASGAGNDFLVDDISFSICIIEDPEPPTPQLEVAASRTGCNAYTLTATLSEALDFVWQQSADNLTWTTIEGKDNLATLPVEITADTYYRILAGETASESVALAFESVTLTISQKEVLLGQEVSLEATPSFDTQSDAVWYENDKVIENTAYSYTLKPYAAASYYVTIDQCASNKVAIEKVIWPTIFTPMLVDGFNDDFVMGMQPAIAMSIYNRAGNLVAETTDGWDGKDAAGNYAMPGVYYFVATLPDGNVVKGNVELLVEKQK